MKSATAWHQRLLLATEMLSLHIRSRDCTTKSIFVTENNVFRSNLFPKQRNSCPKACQGEGRATFLPLLSGNYLPNCWEVLRVSSWCQYWKVSNAFISLCCQSTVRELSTTHPSSCRKFILSPLIQKHFRPLIYAAPSYFLSVFFSFSLKGAGTIAEWWVHLSQRAWSWCSAAEGQYNPAHRGLPSSCSNLNSSPSNSSCCIVPHFHGGQLQPRQDPMSFTSWLKKSQSALRLGWAWGWLCLHISQGGQRWTKCTPCFPWRFRPFRLSSQKGANHSCPVTGNLLWDFMDRNPWQRQKNR